MVALMTFLVLTVVPAGVYSDLYKSLDEQIHSQPNIIHYENASPQVKTPATSCGPVVPSCSGPVPAPVPAKYPSGVIK
jgi:hypothetical protein